MRRSTSSSAGLKRDVEVRAELWRRRHQPHERLGHLVRVDRREANSRKEVLLDEGFRQPDEVDARREVLSIAAEMDAGEDDLLEPLGREAFHLVENLARRQAPALSRGHRDDAEGAEEIAALLHLEERAGLIRERARAERAHHPGADGCRRP
jgi:hypothetical protein